MGRYVRLILVLLFSLVIGSVTTAAQDPDEDLGALVQEVLEEAFNQGNVDRLDEIFAPDYVAHPYPTTLDEFKSSILAERAAFTGYHVYADPIVAEGDLVAFRFVEEGVFENPLSEGDEVLPPTGQPVRIEGGVMLRFNEEGQVVEEWDVFDFMATALQLGLIPAPEGATVAPQTMVEAEMEGADEPMTSGMEDAHKETALAMLASIGDGTSAEFAETHGAPGFRHTNPLGSFDAEGIAQQLMHIKQAMPDFSVVAEQQIAQGDWVATLTRLTGTFTGDLMMPDGSSVTGAGQTYDNLGMVFTRFDANGDVVENLEFFDTWEFYEQLGLMEGVDEGIEEGATAE